MNLLWIHADKMGCGVYRCYVPSLTLQAQGFDCHFIEHGIAKHSDPAKELQDIDVLVLQRVAEPEWLNWLAEARTRGIRVYYEMDDDLFNVPRANPASWFWNDKPTQKRLRRILDSVDGVFASTRPLAEVVTRTMGWGAGRITLAPNHLHPAVWGEDVLAQATPVPSDRLIIGWQGSSTHDTDFRAALPALKQVLQEHPHTLLRLFGCAPLSIKGVLPGHVWQWSKGVPFERYPATLRYMGFDIGIAPVTDSKFNRSKSNLKWMEYSALGVPTVASRVYPYARSIEEGVTGFLAETPEEWYRALCRLIEDAELRATIGAQAKEVVWAQWGPEHAQAWARVLRGAAADDQPRPGLQRSA